MSVASAPLVIEDLDPVDAAAFQRLTGCSDERLAELTRFQALLTEWNAVMNLVGPATIATYWNRHAWDSAQLLTLAPQARTWADLGAGAGLPGVVLAILLKDMPGAKVHLVESMAKRCRFLRVVADELALPVEIHNARAEDLDLKVDVVTARACAPMVRLLGYAQPYLKRGATAWFLKGQDVASELAEAATYWKFESDLRPSLSDPRGQIVQVKGLKSVRKV
ncbi:16S rRNA (guanine(527)-N(7))-methyltransferase RsmG [Caulobacter rhizosphaerae]|jgi:16S rRNA (guanine527-N7)-methyltransferase|uniref:16S rRNA (guanine(527)-N(7))-methyltransferase RsmG n=1 Tax=Caulobacter rhizosphaerae TaxID=2010972 RepID=UPI0013D853E9|nr:16S rRNA (guanine(527)-N(7))-methyltransferase RsmG [Caulobacter rhizosphaerae]GGL44154.1 ribosomal RNA small subunit methyltransferase G [Caulobacter rhizosphaerae]